MGRKSSDIPIIVHMPSTPEGKASLSQKVAAVHAEHVLRCVQRLTCPSEQKQELIRAIHISGRSSA